MMLHIPGVLSREQVTQCRQAIDAAAWADGRATVGQQGAQVKQNRQLPEQSPVAQHWAGVIAQALWRNALFISAALPARVAPPLFNRYEGGEHYGLHIDGAVRALPGGGMLRTDLSSTLFLTDPQDYDGGELVVADTFGTHAVKLPAGDLVLYTASSLHRVQPVTRGARVCSFFWTQSMVRDDQQRTLLFDLDTHIQKLRATLGDTPEVLGLTGHYHNLVRMWSQP